MNGDAAKAKAMARALSKIKTKNQVVICPPFTLLDKFGKTPVGGQDCSAHLTGAYTGEISAGMLAESGAKCVILGHSERRQYHNESSETVRAKAQQALSFDITPIICVGETLADKKAKRTNEVLTDQLKKSLPAEGKVIIAYEPVWAIGTGKSATSKEIASAHAHIQKTMENMKRYLNPILYGGSVKAANAAEIMSIPFVDGVLVGAASLTPEDFIPIITSV